MNIRDYGLPNMETIGTPKAKALNEDMPCPNCGCQLMEVRVPVKSKMLRSKGGLGTGVYMGCPACPWASPMVAIAGGGKDA